MTRNKKRQRIVIPVCIVAALAACFFLSWPRVIEIFSDPVPLSAGEYNTQGVAVFNGEKIDVSTDGRISIKVDLSLTDKGLVHIDIDHPDEDQIFISILPVLSDADLDESGRYDQMLKKYGKDGVYSLTYGSGDYELCVWLRDGQTGNQYTKLYQNLFTADFPENEPYKYSNAYSEFDDNSLVSAYAHALVKNDKTDMEKAKSIIAFVHKKIEYKEGAAEDESGFLTADEIFESGTGVCNSYTSLASAMLKSVGIPTREMRGHNKKANAVHSWCEALIDGEWLTADPAWYGSFPVNPDDYTPANYANPYD